MNRRGLTLLEILLSMSLLGALFVASGRWIQVAAAARAQAEGPRRWEDAARALLSAIHDDLWTGDALAPEGEPAVEIEEGTLRVRTRERGRRGGRVTHAYRFDLVEAEIVRCDLPAEAAPLLAEVGAFEAELAEGALTVRLASLDGRERRRRFVLP